MSQHDLNIANQSFPSFRSDLNNALSAIQTTHSGTSRPTGAVAGQIWLDTTTATSPTLKYYDGADDISLATIDHSANTVNWLDSTVSITGLSTTATGTVLTLSDSASTSTVNLIIDNQKEIQFRETTANGTNYVALKAPASVSADLTFTLPSADGTAGQFLKTDGAGALSFATVSSAGAFKNKIINGDMVLDQRSSGSAVTVNNSARTYAIDRFFGYGSAADGVFTITRDTTAPTGYGFSLKITTTTADASVSASQNYILGQSIEGNNLRDLSFGTASAKTVTLSFWVRSSLTGTFGGSLMNGSNDRSYPFTYTISTANTFEQKTITIAGDTSGTWFTGNNIGMNVWWDLGGGSSTIGTAGAWSGSAFYGATGGTKLIETLNATLYITGVQLEAGTSATDFEFLPIDVSLGRCLRYYYKEFVGSGKTFGASVYATSATNAKVIGKFPVILRADPSALEQSGTAAHYSVRAFSERACTAVPIFVSGTNKYAWICDTTVASGQTGGDGGDFIAANAAAYLAWSAEL